MDENEVEEMDEGGLPEDCSMFANISNRPDNVSSDHIVLDSTMDDSFSEFSLDVPGDTVSTPSTSSRRSRSRRNQNAPSSPASSPARSTRSSSRAAAAAANDSPSRNTRSATRSAAASPTPATSPARVTRRSTAAALASTSSSPARTSRSASVTVPTVPPSTARQGSRSTSGQRQDKTKYKCPKCPNLLASKANLDTHLRSHMMQGVTSRAPTHEKLVNEMPQLIFASLSDLESEPVIRNLSHLCHDYVVSLQEKIKEDISGDFSEMCSQLSDHFTVIMTGKKTLFPSSIRSAMYSGTNKLLSTKEFRVTMRGFLSAFCDGEESVINVVLGNFMFILSKKILVYVIRTMRGCAVAPVIERRKRSDDDINNIDFRQLVYHIGGCIVSGFLWKGKEYSESSHTWTSFCDVLKSKFLRSEDRVNECSEEIRAHTDGMDRGGLKHISDAAFDFFLLLFDFLMSLEGDDGSLPADVIDKYVLQHDVLLCLWDVLVCDYLSELDSLDLLVQVTEKAVKITIKGIMKRRLSEGL